MQIKSRALILKDWKVFLSEIEKAKFYCLPGWTLEDWETTRECVEREIMEELWVKAQVGPLAFMQEFIRDNWETVIDFWYLIENPEDFENLDISSATHAFEVGDYGFFDLDNTDINYAPKQLKEIIKQYV